MPFLKIHWIYKKKKKKKKIGRGMDKIIIVMVLDLDKVESLTCVIMLKERRCWVDS